jgi:glycosyltransferase involved in cell wall biosynthesis
MPAMRILNVAYPFAPVRPQTAGGAEQVVAMLDRALCRAGHQSVVIARQDSQVAGRLIPIPQATRPSTWQIVRSAIDQCRPDLIHLHGLDFSRYMPPHGVPAIATLHLPPTWYDPRAFATDRPRTWLHCVSQSQQAACPPAPNLLPFITNGVPEDLPRAHVSKRNFALALGRICPEKGFHLAFEAAAQAAVPLLLAGEVYDYPEHQAYFKGEILPRCNRRMRFVGAVGPRPKRRLLTAARCVLIPSLAPETSSLVAMEAAMCGTPVIAFPSGALLEIIEHGRTGFLVNHVDEMAAAISHCEGIDPSLCRARALARFSEKQTIASYFTMYESLLRQ